MKAHQGILLLLLCGTFALSAACGGGSSAKSTFSLPASGPNVQAISVNLGPAGDLANGVFTSVTVCAPGTSNCQTIGGVLVDTGSFGLRLLSSALTTSLPQQTGAGGEAVVECFPFVSGTTWGPVQTADIKIASEKAANIAVQVISNAFPVPTGCPGPIQDTLQALHANGILGIGQFIQDCGLACATSTSPGLYYTCTSSKCQATTESVAQQVQNPVAAFATDNNGVMLAIPAAPNPEATLSGALVFGIGTQSNNGLGSATVYTADGFGNFTTTFKGQQVTSSFIDSGSNGIFFLTTQITGLPTCSPWYCPSSSQPVSAITMGANGASGTVKFTVANADSLFAVPGAAVFSQLAGPSSGIFDWGLPFFYGRNVFVAIAGRGAPGGTPPYWAY
ncbi:MAG TPA: DUF3443 domain-containing protein [Candidatus Sulfotelmatobacter sp.]|nr:DUF3443 domain-containing protein [Candidatus Sulfotelmatobacter sp.]